MKIRKWPGSVRNTGRVAAIRAFAGNISRKYEWGCMGGFYGAALRHRRVEKPGTVVQQINLRQIEQIIQKNTAKTVPTAGHTTGRQERAWLLSVMADIDGQGGERRQLEQLIFRRKEQEWQKTVRLQEEAVLSLRRELLQQKKLTELLERRVTESAPDIDRLYAEFRKRLERQLRLEQQRAGL